MKRITLEGLIRITVCLLLLSTVSLETLAAQELDYDLKLSRLIVEFDSCDYHLSVIILVRGGNDDEIQPSEVTVEFLYTMDGANWAQIGYIPVTYAETDIPFRYTAAWPNDFASNPHNEIEFKPDCNGLYGFKAIIHYSRDEDTSNNEKEKPGPYPIDCARQCYVRLRPIDRDHWKYPGPGEYEEAKCNEFPILCDKGGHIPLCQQFPEICPYRGRVEVLFDSSINKLAMVLINKQGNLISRPERIEEPLLVAESRYNQRMVFTKSEGEEYLIVYWPTRETRLDGVLPFPILARPLEEQKR